MSEETKEEPTEEKVQWYDKENVSVSSQGIIHQMGKSRT